MRNGELVDRQADRQWSTLRCVSLSDYMWIYSGLNLYIQVLENGPQWLMSTDNIPATLLPHSSIVLL